MSFQYILLCNCDQVMCHISMIKYNITGKSNQDGIDAKKDNKGNV